MTEPEDQDLPPITEAMSAAGAARAAEEALRQAAHASWSGVSTAADVYTVFGAVGYSLELIPQLLDQLTGWLEKHQEQLDVSDTDSTAAARIADTRTAVTAAIETIGRGRTGVATAQAALAPVFGPVSRQ
jgi:hypothetical protein